MKSKRRKQKILCPDCKTGRDSYLIDETSPVCPYLGCYNGRRCAYYVSIKNAQKNILSQFVNWLKSR